MFGLSLPLGSRFHVGLIRLTRFYTGVALAREHAFILIVPFLAHVLILELPSSHLNSIAYLLMYSLYVLLTLVVLKLQIASGE